MKKIVFILWVVLTGIFSAVVLSNSAYETWVVVACSAAFAALVSVFCTLPFLLVKKMTELPPTDTKKK
ncbi:MAG: hypothetical protein IKC44_06520 [Burkholderiaceae bacterium]|nr:hypothetical protein [Burkholderiaceae bacterium]